MRFGYMIGCLIVLILSGCAPKEITPSALNPTINYTQGEISVYDTKHDMIVFYTYTQKDGKLLEQSWAKMLPFRVEFMDLWVTGLGHDLRRLTNNHAETIKEALLYGAHQKGMSPLHVGENDYLLDLQFAHGMVDAINSYEERMRRYERDRRLPLLLQRL